MPQKNSEDEISSDGEFDDARKMQVYQENETEVFVIEQKKAHERFPAENDSVP